MSLATAHLDKYPIVRGASWKLAFYWRHLVRGDINLTGCVARLFVNRQPFAIGLVDVPTGKITFLLNAAQTDAVSWTQGKYLLEVEFPNGEQRAVATGRITVK